MVDFGTGHDLERVRERPEAEADGPGLARRGVREPERRLDLRGAAAGDEELLLDERPDDAERVVERPVGLCGNQIFNTTSMCAYSTVSTRGFLPCFENSTRAIDPSKNQPNRLRFD